MLALALVIAAGLLAFASPPVNHGQVSGLLLFGLMSAAVLWTAQALPPRLLGMRRSRTRPTSDAGQRRPAP